MIRRSLFILLVVLLLGTPAWAQQTGSGSPPYQPFAYGSGVAVTVFTCSEMQNPVPRIHLVLPNKQWKPQLVQPLLAVGPDRGRRHSARHRGCL